MNRDDVIEYIENRPTQRREDLNMMNKLMDELNNPQDGLNFVHVAGTNGKGSCCAMLTSILKEANYKVGTFISPHLINYEERISVNGIEISSSDFCRLVKKVKDASDKLNITPMFFDILTAVAFLYFREKKCDIVVLEVGLGGRLDATNIIKRPLISVIMNIGLEHTQILGDTLEKIAYEKLGIVKENCDVVTYENKKLTGIYKKVCAEKNAILHPTNFDKVEIISEGIDKQIFNYKSYKNIKLSLLGRHQFYNAAVVIECVDLLKEKSFKINEKDLKNGLRNTIWEARLSILSNEPLFILDGAHNPQCARALADSLPQIMPKQKAIIICGILKDKDYKQIIDELSSFAKEFICLNSNSKKALDKEKLFKYINDKNIKATMAKNVKDAINIALDKTQDDDVILACGSLYLAGEICDNYKKIYKQYLRKKVKEKLKTLSEKEKEEASKIIVKKIKISKEYQKAKYIMIYSALKNEVDLKELTKDKDKIFVYPRCINDKEMIALVPNSENDFEIGKFNIKEPILDKSKIAEKIDLIICPLVAYDKNKKRLGNGKGYYDRFLAKYDCFKIGVGFKKQELKEVPNEKFDRKLDIIYSEVDTFL